MNYEIEDFLSKPFIYNQIYDSMWFNKKSLNIILQSDKYYLLLMPDF
ncbi:MAG: hypothetical protein ACOYBS_09695 [Flavobacterium sp.]